MAKFLRNIDVRLMDDPAQVDPHLLAALRAAPEVGHLAWMYEHHATPLPTGNVGKVNVYLTTSAEPVPPSEVLGIATIYHPFDAARFSTLEPRARQEYYLEWLHGAMLRCAGHFGWETGTLEEAARRIRAADFVFSFFWKKPLTSPPRTRKVQALIEASPPQLSLVFFDKEMQEVRRVLLSRSIFNTASVEFALGKITWIDPATVRVEHQNGRDFWLCRMLKGPAEFHYPRAESGDPHGQYDLGRMYYDGQWVLQDQKRGLELIRLSAAQGFKHAVRFLEGLADRSV